jgi:hypothetical protein
VGRAAIAALLSTPSARTGMTAPKVTGSFMR